MKRRHRRGSYALAPQRNNLAYIRPLVIIAVTALILFFIGAKVMTFFGIGNTLRENAVILALEGRGTISVAIEDDDEFRRAEDQLKLYTGDRISSSGNGYATLSFFDGTIVRLNERSVVMILKNSRGEKRSQIGLEVADGSVWIASPTRKAFSGSIAREVHTHAFTLHVPSETEILMSPNGFSVFASEGLGVRTELLGRTDSILIGEGQQFTAPQKMIDGDPYEHRTPLDPTIVRSPFLEESRIAYAELKKTSQEQSVDREQPAEDFVVSVTEPQNEIIVKSSTIRVSGTVGARAETLRINGYIVSFDEVNHSFSHELALPDEDETLILVEALAQDGTVLEEVRRTVKRDRKPPEPPTITNPASSGETYLTARDTIEITGRASPETVGIIVNDYRLQLFQPEDEEWNYLASTKLDNLQRGENVFEVIAIGRGGYKSEPAVITIILGEGGEGVIEKVEEEGAEGEETVLAPGQLPDNIPTLPGSMQVNAPTPGTFHTATGTEFLIEGTVSEKTDSVWVNDYRLRLYDRGKTFFNYIADTKLGTLSRGANIYKITSRDSNFMILDEVEYTVHFDPRTIDEESSTE